MPTKKSFQNQVFTKGMLYEKKTSGIRTPLSIACRRTPVTISWPTTFWSAAGKHCLQDNSNRRKDTTANSVDADVVGAGSLPSPAIPLRISYSSNRWVVGLGTRLVVVGVCFALPCLLAGLASPCLAPSPCLAFFCFFCLWRLGGGFYNWVGCG